MKLISLNLEKDRHLKARVLPFLRAEQPDVLAVQELCAADIPALEDHFGQSLTFGAMGALPAEKGGDEMGVGVIARQPLQEPRVRVYHGDPEQWQVMRSRPDPEWPGQDEIDPATLRQVLVCGTVGGIRVMTTHLIVTRDGLSTPLQLQLADQLLTAAQAEQSQHDRLLLCGDFNAPRGRATWAKLAAAYADLIPSSYTSSLDPDLHRAGPLPYVVDGLFVHGEIPLMRVRLQRGVSDHQAIVAELAL